MKNLKTITQPHPRVRFCWLCGKRLWNNRHLLAVMEELTGDNIERIVHKHCYISEYHTLYGGKHD